MLLSWLQDNEPKAVAGDNAAAVYLEALLPQSLPRRGRGIHGRRPGRGFGRRARGGGAGAFLRACLPDMIAAGWGRSVNIASIAGKDGNPWMSAHAPSKGGLIALTKSAAKEVATSGVLITCVVPVIESGLTESASEQERALFLSRVPMGRMGEPTNSPSSSRGWPPDGARSPQPAYDLSGGRAVY